MAERCRQIQERIEETRTEAREECRNVSRTISETVCSWLPWPLDDICDVVTTVITEVVCGIVWVVITVVSWVTRIVCEVVFVAVWIVSHVVGFLRGLATGSSHFPSGWDASWAYDWDRNDSAFCPIVIANDDGVPVVPLATIQSQIETAVRVWAQCGIEVIALPITTVPGRPYLANASGCNASGYFGGDRVEYESLSCCPGLHREFAVPSISVRVDWPETDTEGDLGGHHQFGRAWLLPASGVVHPRRLERGARHARARNGARRRSPSQGRGRQPDDNPHANGLESHQFSVLHGAHEPVRDAALGRWGEFFN